MDRKKLALIHIIKKELNLSDHKYRKILQEAAGVNSAKYLTEEKFRQLLKYFVRSKYYRLNRYGLTLRQKLYINHLSCDLGWTQEHLDNFIHKYYHKYHVNELTRKEAIKAIESLKNVKRHQSCRNI